MLRMGRSPRAEQAENEQANINQNTRYTALDTHTPTSPQYHSAETPAGQQVTNPPASLRAISVADSLARDLKEGTLSGFIGNSTVLTGEANFKGMLRVDGHFSGQIKSEKGTLIVSAGGHVEADIEVAVAMINGTIKGDIIASQRIEFGRSAKVTGNIQTPALVIEQGAIFGGNCHMTQPRAAQDKERERPATGTDAPPANVPLPITEEGAGKSAELVSVSEMAS